MELITQFIDILLHLDKHLDWLVTNYGTWTYLVLWLIIFCETGLVVTPFLPGDSLLFAIGALSANGILDITWSLILLAVATILGDTVNYWIGSLVGPKAFSKEHSRWFNKAYLERTHRFYEKHGGKTIIIARFVPIIRTFAPFIAGIGKMTYPVFLLYNVIGALLWMVLILYAGYFFGNILWVKNNFSMVILIIVVISLLPIIIEVWRSWRHSPP